MLLETPRVADLNEDVVELGDDVLAGLSAEVLADVRHPLDVTNSPVVKLVRLRIEERHRRVMTQHLKTKVNFIISG